MNSKHTSFPPFDFLQPGSLKFIRLFKLISSVANSFWLIVHNHEDNKQLKFISQTGENAIYAEKVIFFYWCCSDAAGTERQGCFLYLLFIGAVILNIDVITSSSSTCIMTP